MGVRDLFERTYGTDLVDRWKTNSGFYRRVLEDAGVAADETAAVDDTERCLDWAARVGMRTFRVAPSGTPSGHDVIGGLPELLGRLEGSGEP